MAEPGPVEQRHPEVVRRAAYDGIWRVDEPFPLTPLEAWYVTQGWDVAPAGGLAQQDQGGDGWIRLWQA
jgi:hypothetical protein